MEKDKSNPSLDSTVSQPLSLTLSTPKKTNKLFIYIGVAVLILLVGVGVYYLANKTQSNVIIQKQINNQKTAKPTQSHSSILVTPTAPNTVNSKISFISNGALYTANSDGTNKVLVYKPTGQEAPYLSWDWSPDNHFIVTSNFLINLINNQQTALSINGRCFNWSPDEKKIVYQYNGIYMIDATGKNPKQLTTDGNLCRGSNDVHHWLPDSTAFVYTSNSGIYRYTLTSNTNTLIYDSNNTHIDALSVSVAKEGSNIVFVGRTKYNKTTQSSIANIYTADFNGGNVQQLTNLKQVDEPSDATFTPDGKQIIFSVNNSHSQYNGLALLDIQNKAITELSSTQVYSYYPPSISSDGQYVAYDIIGNNSWSSVILNIKSKQVTQLPYNAFHLLWSK